LGKPSAANRLPWRARCSRCGRHPSAHATCLHACQCLLKDICDTCSLKEAAWRSSQLPL
jgi:hypothetical protein